MTASGFRIEDSGMGLRKSSRSGHSNTAVVEQHNYQLYLAMCDIDHTKTKAKSPQTNGICERFHKMPRSFAASRLTFPQEAL